MSNGEPIVVRVAMKPLPTLMQPLRSARLDTHEAADALVERSDTTAIAAAAVVGEAVVAFELARCVREKFGGDCVGDVLAAHAPISSASRGTPAELAPSPSPASWPPARAPSGRLLAHRLGRRFADADAEVERRAGCSVRALFERDGEAAFRELEQEVTRELLLRDDAPVIALGGGALVAPETRALVRERAFCAWLDVPFAIAWERVEGAPGRAPAGGRPGVLRGPRRAARRDLRRRSADAIVAAEEEAEDVAGALAQRVWTRPGIAELAMGEGAVAIVDRALPLTHAPGRDRAGRRRGGQVACGPRTPLARARRARAGARRRDRVRGRRLRDRRRPASPPRPSGAASPGSRCRPRSSARWTRRSAARRRSTSRPRTTSARSGSRARCCATPSCSRRCRRASGRAAWPRSSRPRCSQAGACGSSSRAGSRASATARRAPSSCSAARASRRSSSRPTPRSAGGAPSSTSATPSATGSSRWRATAGSRTANASRSAWWPRCASRSSSAASRPGRPRASRQLLARHGLPVRAPGLDPAAVLAAMRHDKKRIAGAHRMVLLEAIGRPVYGVAVDEDALAGAVRAATAAPLD